MKEKRNFVFPLSHFVTKRRKKVSDYQRIGAAAEKKESLTKGGKTVSSDYNTRARGCRSRQAYLLMGGRKKSRGSRGNQERRRKSGLAHQLLKKKGVEDCIGGHEETKGVT